MISFFCIQLANIGRIKKDGGGEAYTSPCFSFRVMQDISFVYLFIKAVKLKNKRIRNITSRRMHKHLRFLMYLNTVSPQLKRPKNRVTKLISRLYKNYRRVCRILREEYKTETHKNRIPMLQRRKGNSMYSTSLANAWRIMPSQYNECERRRSRAHNEYSGIVNSRGGRGTK